MAFDVSILKTPQEAQNLMDNARRLGHEELYQRAFARKCELEGKNREDESDPLVKDFWECIAAYEQLLYEKHGKRVRAQYTHRKIKKDGVLTTMQSWARKRGATMGFEMLSKSGQWKLTGEYLVVKYANRFAPEDVEAAKKRLHEAGFAG
jgi:hypothetical protein